MKSISKKIRIVVVLIVLGAIGWFLLLHPYLLFKENEKALLKAGKRYFEINSQELPTGERVKTVSLDSLYKGKYLENDLKDPYTSKPCSISNSWIKTRKEDGKYNYYVYLKCGVFSSKVDHEGPVIKLNGKKDISISLGEEYKDLGVKSVSDKVDGKMNVKDVTIKGDVDSSKIGTYEVKYVAIDKLGNKTTETRVVRVVQKLYKTVKNSLGVALNFKGNPDNNYIWFSNMLYRIWGVDSNKNVILVQDKDISFINYTKIDKWLKYYYNHLNEESRKLIVESKYCNMSSDESLLNQTECSSYTKKRSVYLPSIVEVNKAQGEDGANFMKPNTMSWVSTSKSSSEAYVTRNLFYGDASGKSYLAYDVSDNYGIRPMITIDGEAFISEGDGSLLRPYFLGDTTRGKNGSLLNERNTGEYIFDGITNWIIIDTLDDGTTKVISDSNITKNNVDIQFYNDPEINKIVYNPKNRNSVGYYINNQVSKYLDTSKFVSHSIEVPIYKDRIVYGEEIDTKKYKALLSAPNMYEMFSSIQTLSTGSYWLVNSSEADYTTGAVTEIGVPVNGQVNPYTKLNIRVVGYFNKGTVITSGYGIKSNPYRIK